MHFGKGYQLPKPLSFLPSFCGGGSCGFVVSPTKGVFSAVGGAVGVPTQKRQV